MFKSNKIRIPKSFKSEDGELRIELKDGITGFTEISYDERLFKSSFPVFTLNIENEDKSKVVKEIKEKIINIYKKGIKEKIKLTSTELTIFYFIKNVKSTQTSKSNNALVIGYENNSINSIKNIVLKFNTNCDCFEMPKNIELYTDKTYGLLYDSFIVKCKNKKYNKFIFDITNLYLPTDYSKTKKFIDYIESTNSKILFLIDHADTSYDKFIDIFGNKYMNCVIDKTKYLYAEQNLILYKIENILFK